MTDESGPSLLARHEPRTGPDEGLVVDVLGVAVNPLTMSGAVAAIEHWIDTDRRSFACVTGVHGVMVAQDDPEFGAVYERAGLVTPDGMPLVWACHHAGYPDTERVYGPDLMLAVCQRAVARAWSCFLYGSTPEVCDDLAAALRLKFPGLRIAGMYSPPFRPLTEQEEAEVVRRINESGADIVWVGLSTPKQEKWMDGFRGRLEPPALIGVGAAFDIHAGRLRQAPRVLQRAGLEWLFRLAVEPRRLWRRYLRNNPRFIWRILRQPSRPR